MDQNKDRGQQNQGQPNQNQQSQNPNRDPSEGPRDNLPGGQQGQREQQGGGISNRPLDRERKEQEEVPGRGQNREENR